MSVTGSSAWAAPRVVRVVGIQDGISDSQADYFRRTIVAMLFFHEARELNGAFYIGLGLIVLSVLLQTFAVFLPRPDKAVSS